MKPSPGLPPCNSDFLTGRKSASWVFCVCRDCFGTFWVGVATARNSDHRSLLPYVVVPLWPKTWGLDLFPLLSRGAAEVFHEWKEGFYRGPSHHIRPLHLSTTKRHCMEFCNQISSLNWKICPFIICGLVKRYWTLLTVLCWWVLGNFQDYIKKASLGPKQEKKARWIEWVTVCFSCSEQQQSVAFFLLTLVFMLTPRPTNCRFSTIRNLFLLKYECDIN